MQLPGRCAAVTRVPTVIAFETSEVNLNTSRAGGALEAGDRQGALEADLALVGHMCLDETVLDGPRRVAPGGVAPCGLT
jgi:hypothetical protein